jgi:hypothetical protein
MRFLVEYALPYASQENAQWSEQDKVDLERLQDHSFHLIASAVAAFPWTKPTMPLENVLWNDPSWNLAIEYCVRDENWRNNAQNHGLIEVYRLRGHSVP